MSLNRIRSILMRFVDGIIVLNEQHVIISHEFNNSISLEVSNGMPISHLLNGQELNLIDNEKLTTSLNEQKFRITVRIFPEEEKYTFICIESYLNSREYIEGRLYCLERVIDSLDEGVMMSNEEGEIILYNNAQEKMEGLNSHDIIGKHLWSVYNYNPQYSEHKHTFKSGKPIFSRYRAHSTINGIPKYVNYNTYPIKRNNQTVAVFSLSTNESKLKDQLHQTIEIKRKSTPSEPKQVAAENGTIFTFKDIRGKSLILKNLIKEAQNVSLHNADTLIVGETGTGKELFAQSMHNHSARANKPFVAINCAAIPENLLESTLFGTVKGAFTGATDQIGLFEYAEDGTLFLDEINSMPITLQSKLMRVLQERLVRKVGSNDVSPVRCTIISASNEDPETLIEEEKMRLDLFYRIAHTSLYIPPLRERTEDVHYFINYFLDAYQKKFVKSVPPLSNALQTALLHYNWPGNTRELEHLIENLIIRVPESSVKIEAEHLPSYMRKKINTNTPIETAETVMLNKRPVKELFSNSQKHYIESTLEETNWNVSQAAKKLGITRQSLQYHIKKHNLSRPTIK